MAKAKRRIRSPHPGVVLIPPDPEHGHPNWRARFIEPDTGRSTKITIAELTTAEARRDWAIRKAKTLGKRRMDLEAGAPRATGTALADAVDRYFKDHPQLRASTVEAYKAAGKKLVAWATRGGLRSADDVTAAHLVAFRAELVKEPKRTRAKGGKRGAQRATDKARSPYTVNRELVSTGTILGYLRRLGLLPRLTSDDLRDGLRRMQTKRDLIDYRKPAELRKLLEAALRHDAETFDETRAEHAGRGEAGSTPRYDPIAPFVAAVMLTGARFGEMIDLDWKQVDLDALDHDGKAVGEIRLTSAVKTKRARTIALEVSPALRRVLAALKLRHGGRGSVFGLTRDTADAGLRRMIRDYGAPAECGWQALRRTCGTYLTNSPQIFGSASAYHSARQLGHSVQVAERHYLGLIRGLPRDARTLEAAMQIEAEMAAVVDAVGVTTPLRSRAG